jgi:hypothetical protein
MLADEPISPELVLVCPELARTPLVPSKEPAPTRRVSVRRHRPARLSRRRRNVARPGLALPLVGALAFAFALAPRQASTRPVLLDEPAVGDGAVVASVLASPQPDGILVLWRLADGAPGSFVTLWRSEAGAGGALVYRGSLSSFLDRTARSGRRYRYTVQAHDSSKQRTVDAVLP